MRDSTCVMLNQSSFPNAKVERGEVSRERVFIDELGTSHVVTVLSTGGIRLFELGRELRNSLYGIVAHGIEVVKLGSTFKRVSPRRDVAIKSYNKEKIRRASGLSKENPMGEFSVMQYFGEHPNLMSLLSVCEDATSYYLVMNFMDGGELFDLIFENPLSEIRARSYIRQILAGLKHLHSAGLAHRDLSLENVLLSSNGQECKIIDYGMTVQVPYNQELQQYSKMNPSVCGKSNYMAPEVLQNFAPYNPQLCDIWAIGIMTFIMLTSCPLVNKAVESDPAYKAIINGNLPLLIQNYGFHISLEVIDFIQFILRPNPEDRPTIQQILNHPWMKMDIETQ